MTFRIGQYNKLDEKNSGKRKKTKSHFLLNYSNLDFILIVAEIRDLMVIEVLESIIPFFSFSFSHSRPCQGGCKVNKKKTRKKKKKKVFLGEK